MFGSSIAAQMMQEPGKQTSHAALQNSQVVSITSSIPVPHTIPQLAPGTDMLTSPTFCLSHYLYRSALIAALFNKQCIAFVYFCITFFFSLYMFLNDMLHPYTLVRPKYARGFSTPQYGVRSPNTLTSTAPRTYSIIRIGSESCLGSIVGFARLLCFGALRSAISAKVALGEPL